MGISPALCGRLPDSQMSDSSSGPEYFSTSDFKFKESSTMKTLLFSLAFISLEFNILYLIFITTVTTP